MTDYLDEIKDRVAGFEEDKETYEDVTAINFKSLSGLYDDLSYLIRRLEEREHKVKTLNDQLKGCRKK